MSTDEFHENPYARGSELIKEYVKNLPEKPGVYRMIGFEEKVLYVGKAKSLKARVISYARVTGLTRRIMRMVSETLKMEFVVTRTEAEALLLESDLIKNLKPHFNILLRDDKSYPYILIQKDHSYAKLTRHRGAKSAKGRYFGPFASAGSVYQTLNILQRAFLLRTCADSVFENRSRPCLLYQIKRCSAPCTGLIDKEGYDASVKSAEDFLTGKSKEIIRDFTEKMYLESENQNYERAANYRDRIKALSAVSAKSGFHPQSVSEADVFSLFSIGGAACVQVFFFRVGQNWGGAAYFPKAAEGTEPAEILDGFLGRFYQDKPAPKLILLSHEIESADFLEEALTQKSHDRVKIECPARGEKREIVQYALTNAEQALARRTAESAAQSELLEKLAETLGLENTPQRIEVYDNAHISGTNAVGAMIVAGADGFRKKDYRTWKIKNTEITPGDDYGMMREVLGRRLKRLQEEAAENPESAPDLIILDGGQGQLSAVTEIAEQLGADHFPIIAVAKGKDRNAGRERFYFKDKPSFILPENDPVLYFVQRLRDEAHRFANGTHSRRRATDMKRTGLDDIPGVGAERRKSLIAKFGSAKAVQSATLEEIAQTPGVSRTVAKKIYDYFREG